MSNVKYDSIVNRAEADALKEMIFKRARERAAALDADVKTNYTSTVKNDIMDLARDSFVAERNPFAQQKPAEAEPKPVEDKHDKSIGFPARKVDEIKSQITFRNKVTQESLVNSQMESNMAEARNAFAKKESFMGALNFLNSQASVALIKSHGQSFEAIA